MSIHEIEGTTPSEKGPRTKPCAGHLRARKVQSQYSAPSLDALKKHFQEFQEKHTTAVSPERCLKYLAKIQERLSACPPQRARELHKVIDEACQILVVKAEKTPLTLFRCEREIEAAWQKCTNPKPMPAAPVPDVRKEKFSPTPAVSDHASIQFFSSLGKRSESAREKWKPSIHEIRQRRIEAEKTSVYEISLPTFFEMNRRKPFAGYLALLFSQQPSELVIGQIANLLGIPSPDRLNTVFLKQLQMKLDAESEKQVGVLIQEFLLKSRQQIQQFPQKIASILLLEPTKDTIHQLQRALHKEDTGDITSDTLEEISKTLEALIIERRESEEKLLSAVFSEANRRLPLPESIASLMGQSPTIALAQQLASIIQVPWNADDYVLLGATLQKRLETFSQEELQRQQIEKNRSKEQVQQVYALLKRFGHDVVALETLVASKEDHVDYAQYLAILKTFDPSIHEDEDLLSHISQSVEKQVTEELQRHGHQVPKEATVFAKLDALDHVKSNLSRMQALYEAFKDTPLPQVVRESLDALRNPSEAAFFSLAEILSTLTKKPTEKKVSAEAFRSVQEGLDVAAKAQKKDQIVQQIRTRNSSFPEVTKVISVLQRVGIPCEPLAAFCAASGQKIDYARYRSLLKDVGFDIPEDKNFFDEICASLEIKMSAELKKNEREIEGPFEDKLAAYESLQHELKAIQRFYEEVRAIPILPGNFTSLLAAEPTLPRYEYLAEVIGKESQTSLSTGTDAESVEKLLTSLQKISQKEQERRSAVERIKLLHDTNRSLGQVKKVTSLLTRYGLNTQRLDSLLRDSLGVISYDDYLMELKELGFEVDKDENTYEEVFRQVRKFLAIKLLKASLPISTQRDAVARTKENLATYEKYRTAVERIKLLHATNRSLGQVKKVTSLLTRYGLNTQRLDSLLRDSLGVISYDDYLMELKELGFKVNKDKNTLEEVSAQVRSSFAIKLHKASLPISTQRDAADRLEENLATYEKYRTDVIEVKTRFRDIEQRAIALHPEVVSIMRGPPTQQKWEQLISWCNTHRMTPLPVAISAENRVELLEQVVATLDAVHRSTPAVHEGHEPLFDAAALLRTIGAGWESEKIEIMLVPLQNLQNDSLLQALTVLYTMPPEKVRPFHPLLTDLITNLATGSVRTQAEVERIVGELIFLIDSNVDVHDIPQELSAAYAWVERQARLQIRSRQESLESEISDPRMHRLCTEEMLRETRLPQLLADLLITNDGYCNTGLSTLVREIFLPKKDERTAAQEHLASHLSLLRSSPALRAKLSSVTAPPLASPGCSLVRISLGQSLEHRVTAADARKVCLGALFAWHRQGALGDCFVSSQYEFAADEASLWILDDFRELIEQGSLTRTFGGKTYTIDGLPWQALFISISTIRQKSKEQLRFLYEVPLFQQALSELGTVTQSAWETLVDHQTPPFDVRSMFLQINPDIDAVQRALLCIESQGHNPLQRMWQNAAASMQYVDTPGRELPKARGLFAAVQNACIEIAHGSTPQSHDIQEKTLSELCAKLRYCVVSQNPRNLSVVTHEELSLIPLYQKSESQWVRLGKEDLKHLLGQTFAAIYPDIAMDHEKEELLFQKYLEHLKTQGVIDGVSSADVVGGVLLLQFNGGKASQDIFERQLIPCSYTRLSSFDVRPLLAWTQKLMESKPLPSQTSFIVNASSHLFRLLPLHKSLVACATDPQEAIDRQIDFANHFRDQTRPFSDWMQILKQNNLGQSEFIHGMQPPAGEGTITQFLDAFLGTLTFSAPAYKEAEKKQLQLRFLLQECNEKHRVAVLHYADTNWRKDGSTPYHFALLYNPFSGTWEHITIDDKDSPRFLDETSPHLDNILIPLQAIRSKIIEEASKKQLLILERKTQQQLDQLERSFALLVNSMERDIQRATELKSMQKLLEQEAPSIAPRKTIKETPKNFEEPLLLAYEMHARYQQILQEIAKNPGAYRTIHGTPSSRFLADIQRLKERCQELITERRSCLSVESTMDIWKRNLEPTPEHLVQLKHAIESIPDKQFRTAQRLIRCIETFQKLQTFESREGSSWAGVWIDPIGQLTAGTVYARQNTAGVGEFLHRLLMDVKPSLSGLSTGRKTSMIRSLEALQKIYPDDVAIQTAVREWGSALQKLSA